MHLYIRWLQNFGRHKNNGELYNTSITLTLEKN